MVDKIAKDRDALNFDEGDYPYEQVVPESASDITQSKCNCLFCTRHLVNSQQVEERKEDVTANANANASTFQCDPIHPYVPAFAIYFIIIFFTLLFIYYYISQN